MLTKDFSYDLPADLIAQRPLAQRSASRMLVLDGQGGLQDRQFQDFKQHLSAGDLLVINNTRVMAARLYGQKETGGRVEILVERILDNSLAIAQIRASKAPKPGSSIELEHATKLTVRARRNSMFELELVDGNWLDLLQKQGHIPLPPYIERDDDSVDESRYQTVFAKHMGAVAAPTAGLHFDAATMDDLKSAGIETAEVTLHVGAGTYQPVRVERIEDHEMHAEWIEVTESVCQQVTRCKRQGGKIVAVGTTSLRALESAARNGTLAPFTGDTRLFVSPGYTFNVVDTLLTNFHLPESSLMMLVTAFGGYENVMEAYRHAVQAQYRFFSYGDAMLIQRSV
jgi:S-adenosylmethionine:tRNA ribosyltransferase-isomerase